MAVDLGKDAVALKLKKIIGQLNGVLAMYEEERSCLDIVQQVAASRSALSGVAKDLLADEASRCARCRTPEDFDRILKTLVEMT
ncbi:MAG: metal-sensitive transcriptional regulator [Candidatus Woesebacteria bacterium]